LQHLTVRFFVALLLVSTSPLNIFQLERARSTLRHNLKEHRNIPCRDYGPRSTPAPNRDNAPAAPSKSFGSKTGRRAFQSVVTAKFRRQTGDSPNWSGPSRAWEFRVRRPPAPAVPT
jgi:hypothetical protein